MVGGQDEDRQVAIGTRNTVRYPRNRHSSRVVGPTSWGDVVDPSYAYHLATDTYSVDRDHADRYVGDWNVWGDS